MASLPTNLNAARINLSGQGLTEIPKELFSYKNLRKLYLRNNRIESIPKEITNLKLLTVLDISNNNLTSIHSKTFDLKRLEVLILNNNRIKNIPSQIKNFKKLRVLGLANNKFITLNAHLNFLTELKELNLSGNFFIEFPKEIFYLKNLEKLWLSNYDFEIPDLSVLRNDFPYLRKMYKSSSIKIKALKATNSMSAIGTIKIDPLKLKKKTVKAKKIFISYSHRDEEYLSRIKTHLKVLRTFGENDFEVWDDNKINAGDKWQEEIKNALSNSTAAILLISTDYLASDFINKEELQPLLLNAEKEGTIILPLILKPCRFTSIESLSVFQSVNNPKTQILSKLSEPEKDEVLLLLTEAVERHVNG